MINRANQNWPDSEVYGLPSHRTTPEVIEVSRASYVAVLTGVDPFSAHSPVWAHATEWPNLDSHGQAWEQARLELGADAGVRQVLARAQEILTRSRAGEDYMEQARRLR